MLGGAATMRTHAYIDKHFMYSPPLLPLSLSLSPSPLSQQPTAITGVVSGLFGRTQPSCNKLVPPLFLLISVCRLPWEEGRSRALNVSSCAKPNLQSITLCRGGAAGPSDTG